VIGCSLILVSIVTACSSCRSDAQSGVTGRLPDQALARRAVEIAMQAWRESPGLALSSSPSPSVMFVDQRRRPGQPLRAFTVLSESESEGFRRYQIKLALAEPDESRVAAYCVFGVNPIWVYRSEDFDMIMHWECPMPADSQSPFAPSEAEDKLKPDQSHDNRRTTPAPLGASAG
jgi:hypothetical protein